MRKKGLALVFGIVLLMAGSAQADTVLYTNYLSWVGAFGSGNFIVENFEDQVLQPGLIVNSDYSGAKIEDGVYKDIVGGTSNYTTTWNLTNFGAFGGWWDLANPGGVGTSIAVTVIDTAGISHYIGEINEAYNGGFWGFSTDYHFGQVIFSEGQTGGLQETYWSVDLAYTQVPEPGTLLLLGCGLLGMYGIARKKN